uniref:Uncharacterized protein n=1 Tax=Saccoglossus kowalevskii TaxID=10224 RepID=A0ABM0MNH1_SACKO|nr:PREDICTED: putative uncharacterized protein DDB_G0285869-like [Saccoglossus kowalevskii]
MKGHTRKTCPNSQTTNMQMMNDENNSAQNSTPTDSQQMNVVTNLNSPDTLHDKDDDITDIINTQAPDTEINNHETDGTTDNIEIETEMNTDSSKYMSKKRTRSRSPVHREEQNNDQLNDENKCEPSSKKRNDENAIEIVEKNCPIDEERVRTPPSPSIAPPSPPPPPPPHKPFPHVYANVTVCTPKPQPELTESAPFPSSPSLEFTVESPRDSPLSELPH